jgi:hypothetical protein
MHLATPIVSGSVRQGTQPRNMQFPSVCRLHLSCRSSQVPGGQASRQPVLAICRMLWPIYDEPLHTRCIRQASLRTTASAMRTMCMRARTTVCHSEVLSHNPVMPRHKQQPLQGTAALQTPRHSVVHQHMYRYGRQQGPAFRMQTEGAQNARVRVCMCVRARAHDVCTIRREADGVVSCSLHDVDHTACCYVAGCQAGIERWRGRTHSSVEMGVCVCV